MIIGSNSKLSQFNDIDLMAKNSQLEKVTKFKYLGVTINQHLTWHDHIDQIQRKVSKRLGVLLRIKHLLPAYARNIYVMTMVIPILEYASIVWGDKNNKVLMVQFKFSKVKLLNWSWIGRRIRLHPKHFQI